MMQTPLTILAVLPSCLGACTTLHAQARFHARGLSSLCLNGTGLPHDSWATLFQESYHDVP